MNPSQLESDRSEIPEPQVAPPTALPEWAEAEAQRKSGQYASAGRAFHAFWKQRGQAAAGWRYAFCLRKAGYPTPALNVALRTMKAHPDDQAARNELVWCLYFARLKPAQAAEDEQGVLQAARDMAQTGATGLPLELAVFAAMGAAKGKGHWGEVSRWCDLLDPEVLSDTPQDGPGNRKIPSPRERYYFARVKAWVQQERWTEALGASLEACSKYPRNIEFLRWQAEARAGLGQLEEAVQLLQGVSRERRARWYHLADLARFLMELNRLEEAWEAAQAALRMPAEDQARVGLLGTMARIALERNEPEVAARHLAWCLALRREQGWPTPPPLAGLRGRLEATEVDWEAPSRNLRRACLPDTTASSETHSPARRLYGRPPGAPVRPQAGQPEAPEAQRPGEPPPLPDRAEDGTLTGTVISYQQDRPFAFLRAANGERIFVLASDLPEECRHDGARARFVPVRNFDRKKQKESWRASQLQPAD